MFKLFKKEEPKTKTVDLNGLHDWLDEELSQINFSKELNNYFENITSQKNSLKEKNELLRIAQVNEKDKVEDRVKSIVIGQKNSFVTEVDRFLNNLQIPEEKTLRITINFNTELNKTLDDLAQKTTKSYQTTTHLFFHQVQEVYKSIGEINLQARKFKNKIERKKLDKIEELLLTISKIHEETEYEKHQEQDIEQKNTKVSELEKEKELKEKKIKTIKESPEYKQNIELKKEKEEIQIQLNTNKDEVNLFFSKLGRALRKYQKVSLEYALIKEYLEEPATTFFNDKELKIIEILLGLKRAMNNKEVNLNEKQEKNTLELLKEIEKGFLNIKQEKQISLQEKFNSLHTEDLLTGQIINEENKISNIEKEIAFLQGSNKKLEKSPENSDKQAKLIELALELFDTKLIIRKTI